MSVNKKKQEQVLKDYKKSYEETEIPKELSQIVQDTILKAKQDLLGENTTNGKVREENNKKPVMRSLISVAAAMIVLVGAFGITVNTSQVFAQSLQDVPILGTLVKVFTGSEIKEQDNVANIDALIPEVEGLKDKKLQVEINQEVNAKINQAIKETKEIIADYKKAWLETGGKEEEYIPLEINVNYDVKCINDNTLSFVVYKTQTLANAYYEEIYYNYDLNKSTELTLKDVLGKNYMKIVNEQIKAQIAERSKDIELMFWSENEGGFTSISDKQNFYINKAGNPVIIFQKYEIAPGSMGTQEFEIVK